MKIGKQVGKTPFIPVFIPDENTNFRKPILKATTVDIDKFRAAFFTPTSLSFNNSNIVENYFPNVTNDFPSSVDFLLFKLFVAQSFVDSNTFQMAIISQNMRISAYVIARWLIDEKGLTIDQAVDLVGQSIDEKEPQLNITEVLQRMYSYEGKPIYFTETNLPCEFDDSFFKKYQPDIHYTQDNEYMNDESFSESYDEPNLSNSRKHSKRNKDSLLFSQSNQENVSDFDQSKYGIGDYDYPDNDASDHDKTPSEGPVLFMEDDNGEIEHRAMQDSNESYFAKYTNLPPPPPPITEVIKPPILGMEAMPPRNNSSIYDSVPPPEQPTLYNDDQNMAYLPVDSRDVRSDIIQSPYLRNSGIQQPTWNLEPLPPPPNIETNTRLTQNPPTLDPLPLHPDIDPLLAQRGYNKDQIALDPLPLPPDIDPLLAQRGYNKDQIALDPLPLPPDIDPLLAQRGYNKDQIALDPLPLPPDIDPLLAQRGYNKLPPNLQQFQSSQPDLDPMLSQRGYNQVSPKINDANSDQFPRPPNLEAISSNMMYDQLPLGFESISPQQRYRNVPPSIPSPHQMPYNDDVSQYKYQPHYYDSYQKSPF